MIHSFTLERDDYTYEVTASRGRATSIVRYGVSGVGTRMSFDELDFLTQACIESRLFEDETLHHPEVKTLPPLP